MADWNSTTPSRVARFSAATVTRLLRELAPGKIVREDASPLALRANKDGGSWIVVK